jgi:C1A family cysteine protease
MSEKEFRRRGFGWLRPPRDHNELDASEDEIQEGEYVMPQTRNRRGFGWKPDLPDHRDHLFAAPAATLAALPPRVDLRSQCPRIYDQGRVGSCTANAIAGAFEFDRIKQGLPDLMPSRLFIYYNEREMEHSVASDAGAFLRDGIKSISKRGVCPEPDWPYDGNPFPDIAGDPFPPNQRLTVKPPQSCYETAKKYTAISYQSIVRSLSQMKGCLASGFPFVFGFSVYQSFISDEVWNTGVVPMPSPNEPGANEDGSPAGHAMLVVGYDDSEQRFIIRNSWGEEWGMQGYGTMPYAYFLEQNLSDDFWAVQLVN